MKVPSRIRRAKRIGAQDFGRHDITGPMRVAGAQAAAIGREASAAGAWAGAAQAEASAAAAQAQLADVNAAAISTATNSINGLIDDYRKRQGEMEEQDANIALSEASVTHTDQHAGKRVYQPSELDPGLRTNSDRVNIPAYEVSPEIRRDAMTKSINEIAKTITDKRVRSRWVANQNGLVTKNYVKNKEAAIKTQIAFQNSKTELTANQAVTDQEYEKARGIISGSNLGELAKSEFQVKIDQRQEMDGYVDAIRTGDIARMEIYKEQLSLDEVDSSLPPALQLKYHEILGRALDNALKGEVAEMEKEAALEASDLSIKISDSPHLVSRQDIDDLFHRGVITGPQRTAMTKNHSAGVRAYNETVIGMAGLEAKVRGGSSVDPGDNDEKKYAEAIYKKGLSELPQDASAADVDSYVTNYIRTYKHVPESIQSRLRSANVSDKGELLKGVAIYNQIMRAAPTAMTLSDDDLSNVKPVAALIASGVDPSRAFDRHNQWQALSKDQKAGHLAAVGEGDKTRTKYLEEAMDRDFGEWLSFDPAVRGRLEIKFKSLVLSHLPQTGSVEAARVEAWNVLKTTHAVTRVNDKRQFMPYGPHGDQELLRKDVVMQYGENATVVSDLTTAREHARGAEKSYAIFEVDKDTGRVMHRARWTPDRAGLKKAAAEKVVRDAADHRKVLEDERQGITTKRGIAKGGVAVSAKSRAVRDAARQKERARVEEIRKQYGKDFSKGMELSFGRKPGGAKFGGETRGGEQHGGATFGGRKFGGKRYGGGDPKLKDIFKSSGKGNNPRLRGR